MANDPIYGKPILDVSQAGKEHTIAEFLATVARGAGGVHEVTATTGTVVLTAEQAENGLIRATGTLVANVLIQLPADHVAGRRIISNETAGAFDLEVEFDGGAAAVTIPQGDIAIFLDGEVLTVSESAAARFGGANVTFGLRGSGVPIANGSERLIVLPADVTLYKVELYADQAATAELELLLGDYAGYPGGAGSIVASAPPELTAADQSADSTLMGWTKVWDKNEHLIASVVSNDVAEELTLVLYWTEN